MDKKIQQVTPQKINPNFKCGLVSIIGRPSVGKSTFINTVCGENTSITSSYPQTTRSIIKGIVSRDSYQIVFLDTPGLHFSDDIFGTTLRKQSSSSLKDVDAILYMLDASRPPKEEETKISEMLSQHTNVVIVCNKCDIQPNYHAQYLDLIHNFFPSAPLHSMSAINNNNVDALLDTVSNLMPLDNALYPTNYYTDQSPEVRMCEQVRAVAIENVYQELPYALYTQLLESSIKDYNDDASPKHVLVRIEIVVETPNQLGIVVGKGGKSIRKIRIESAKRINKIFDYNVQLELRVGVQKKWRKNASLITSLAQR